MFVARWACPAEDRVSERRLFNPHLSQTSISYISFNESLPVGNNTFIRTDEKVEKYTFFSRKDEIFTKKNCLENYNILTDY